MSVKFTDNSKLVKSQIESNINAALNAIGVKWIDIVSPLVPVDTANLVKSMTYETNVSAKEVVVGTPVEYSEYVELGTRKMKAQPYLRPSIMDHKNEYRDAAAQVLGKRFK